MSFNSPKTTLFLALAYAFVAAVYSIRLVFKGDYLNAIWVYNSMVWALVAAIQAQVLKSAEKPWR